MVLTISCVDLRIRRAWLPGISVGQRCGKNPITPDMSSLERITNCLCVITDNRWTASQEGDRVVKWPPSMLCDGVLLSERGSACPNRRFSKEPPPMTGRTSRARLQSITT
jgi:hypothetical protein